MSASRAEGSVRVAALRAEDAPGYRALMLRAYDEAPDAFTSTSGERAAEPAAWWVRRIAEPGHSAAFGAFDDRGEIVGAVALEFSNKPKTAHDALLIGLFVAALHRAGGIGRALVDAAIVHCAERGDIASIKLTVTEGNEAAIALYRSAGFEPFGTEPRALRTERGFLAKVHMWRALPFDTGSTR